MRTLRRILSALRSGFDRPGLRNAFTAGLGTLLFFFPFSLLFVAGGLLPGEFSWTASLIIILNGLVTVLSELRHGPRGRTTRDFFLLVLVLAGVEWVGVRTGYPFGPYRYTDALPPTIDGIPLAIAFAWYASVVNARRLGEAVLGPGSSAGPWAVALVAGLITLGIDIVLEPMASMINGYWIWEGTSVPLQNYVSWFVLGTLAAFWLARPSPAHAEPAAVCAARQATAAVLLGMQWVLFAATNLAHGFFMATAVSLLLLALLWTGFAHARRLQAPGFGKGSTEEGS